MPSITKQKMDRYTYIYNSMSYWDKENKRPDNYKKSIGKIDNETGEKEYKQHYIDKLKLEGKPTNGMKIWVDGRKKVTNEGSISQDDFSDISNKILGTVKDYGVAYFLQAITEKTGLLNLLGNIFPQTWGKIVVLAYYLISSDKPVMYCNDWYEENEFVDVGSMVSQRVSELLASFGHKERLGFYKQWYSHIQENEYIALDITSVSSYSKNIECLEWGYNRDGEDLPQANICMLFGEKSQLPIYQTFYSGSLCDVSTLETTLAEFSAITDTKDIILIMDKGFYSEKNVRMLLDKKGGRNYKFILPVSFSSNFAKNLTDTVREGIDSIENVIFSHGSIIRGTHKTIKWKNTGAELHAHIFYNPEKATKDRNDLYNYVANLKTKAGKDPENKKLQKEYKRYLVVDNPENANGNILATIRKDEVEKTLKTAGWFILISNHICDTQTAYDIYRAKDVVEKSFFQYKNNLGINRFHVHNDERMKNKTFIAFIALILSCHIHKIMKEKEMDKHMTFEKLLITLKKIKSAHINGNIILRPLTKEQKSIFKNFDIQLPKFTG